MRTNLHRRLSDHRSTGARTSLPHSHQYPHLRPRTSIPLPIGSRRKSIRHRGSMQYKPGRRTPETAQQEKTLYFKGSREVTHRHVSPMLAAIDSSFNRKYSCLVHLPKATCHFGPSRVPLERDFCCPRNSRWNWSRSWLLNCHREGIHARARERVYEHLEHSIKHQSRASMLPHQTMHSRQAELYHFPMAPQDLHHESQPPTPPNDVPS